MHNLHEALLSGQEKLAVIGLGYVGLPIAAAFAKKVKVIGFDCDEHKINLLNRGVDPTKEVGDEEIRRSSIEFTSDPKALQAAKFLIVAVPTPIDDNHVPDLSYLKAASEFVGQNLQKDSIVVFESTVYPGVTEDTCIPILERASKLACEVDFKVGYSPERINPGDKEHSVEQIVKVVSGIDEEALAIVTQVYGLIIQAGLHQASSIKVAEGAKVIENAQRDINIAFMNELSIIFHRLGVDTREVLEAAKTKWNFLDFSPGLVGGHCIGIDPYYLTYKAEELGYHSQVILAGRKINDDMGKQIADQAIKMMVQQKKDLSKVKVGIFGFTFKENCPDVRNTKVLDIIKEFQEYLITPVICDPEADQKETERIYDVQLSEETEMQDLDLLIIAVSHQCFITKDHHYWLSKLKNKKIIMDVKGILDKNKMERASVLYWRL